MLARKGTRARARALEIAGESTLSPSLRTRPRALDGDDELRRDPNLGALEMSASPSVVGDEDRAEVFVEALYMEDHSTPPIRRHLSVGTRRGGGAPEGVAPRRARHHPVLSGLLALAALALATLLVRPRLRRKLTPASRALVSTMVERLRRCLAHEGRP